MKFSTVIIVSFLFLADFCAAQSGVLDIAKFGGKPNSDIGMALTAAWKEACASTTAAKIVIPAGTYQLNGIELKGPCKAPIELQVDGTIQAPADPSVIKGTEQWFKFLYMDHLTLSGKGVFDGQGASVYKKAQPAAAWSGKGGNSKNFMNFGFNFVNNSLVHGVTSKDSKNFHVMVFGCNNITFDSFTITAPGDSPNTDGIHMGKSTGVKILNTNIGTGDDCVSIGDGSKQITVEGVKCGPGHGLSIGSLGKFTTEENVEGITIKNCTLTATDNGVRIKTWPDAPGTITVSDIHFEDITMTNVKNPVIIDQEYCPWNACSKKNPSKIKLSKITFKNVKGTSGTAEGVVLICSSAVPCDGVELNNVDLKFNGAPTTAKCTNVKPIVTGTAPVCQAPGAAPAASTTASPAAGKAPAGKSPAK
ncbi:Polygalacturonase [Medicago truncatula]|uniref:Polygalacturonase n=3 Tax=Medicago truncatula TaxID=3880 RepID=G7ISY0_MEDTR|nr:polygalacturonase [Medicago truncatula]XP_024631595.1 polygalacturonase [Medicago truncatula]AES65910.1 polygalacturonase 11c, putative [Medicago truncatula]AFK38160.1 unknown [Medicago truncatula]RHN74215.1 Polygalacturonase [Medicago truncatula]RHN74216.1 Polygalacturonase [Medicago truncatula]